MGSRDYLFPKYHNGQKVRIKNEIEYEVQRWIAIDEIPLRAF